VVAGCHVKQKWAQPKCRSAAPGSDWFRGAGRSWQRDMKFAPNQHGTKRLATPVVIMLSVLSGDRMTAGRRGSSSWWRVSAESVHLTVPIRSSPGLLEYRCFQLLQSRSAGAHRRLCADRRKVL
jgi:hypothetical protein